MAVLYFLVVCALTIAAVLFVQRSAARNAIAASTGAQLIGVADEALYGALANWDGVARLRQGVGTTSTIATTTPSTLASVYVTRLSAQIFAIVADARSARDGAARRVRLLVRVPVPPSRLRAALISAGDVSIGPDARILVDSGPCGDGSAAGVIMPPAATVSVNPALSLAYQPNIVRDLAASDSATYLQLGRSSWNDLTLAADISIPRGSHVTPSPASVGAACSRADANWGDPTSLTSACADYAPIVFAAGDLVIDGGRGQGVLLVDGHLVIAGAFTYSGQIVARRGIETRADNIAISGVVYAARGPADSTLTHDTSSTAVLSRRTTLRYSRCDAWHGMASWLIPRRARDYAWTELF